MEKAWIVTEGDAAVLASRIGALLQARVLEPVRVHRTYLDSFDWRLWRKGELLIDEQTGEPPVSHALTWKQVDGRVLLEASLPERPRFGHQLPDPKGKLAGRLEMRALLARAELVGEIFEIERCEPSGEVALRGELSSLAALEPSARIPLPHRLVLSVRSEHEGELSRAAELLSALPLQEAASTPLEEALAVLGRKPGDYSSKVEVELQGDERAEQATREILRRIFAIQLTNEPGVRADLDTEFLHDFRVAVRRTRSVLGQLKELFPKQETRDFSERFRWLGQVTGPMRDLDVFLLDLLDERAAEGEPAALAPLRDLVREQRAQALLELRAELSGERYARLCADWGQFLAKDTRGPLGRKPIRKVVGRRIRKLAQRVARQSSHLAMASPEELHELRKTCKKLRYLTEFYGSLFPSEPLAESVSLLKGAQSTLGELQDLAVQSQRLTSWTATLAEREGVTPDHLLAVGVMVEKLLLKRQALHEALVENFDGRALQERFEQLVRPPRGSEPEGSELEAT